MLRLKTMSNHQNPILATFMSVTRTTKNNNIEEVMNIQEKLIERRQKTETIYVINNKQPKPLQIRKMLLMDEKEVL